VIISDFLVVLNDPNFRALAMPVIRESVGWAISRVRERRESAPAYLREASDANLKQFADALFNRMSERIREDSARDALIFENLGRPAGVSDVERALDAATEIEDTFTRESLAALVARTMTSRRESAEKIATRIATDASRYLSERHLRLLAFMSAIMGTHPDAAPPTPEEWTTIVIAWLRNYVSRLVVDSPSLLDLSILESAGVVTVAPQILTFEFNRQFISDGGMVPNLIDFARNDPLGIRISSAYKIVERFRPNLAGRLLAITSAELITGQRTKIPGISGE